MAPTQSNNLIAKNKKAGFEYHLEDRFEAGLALEGWEVKALRAGRVQFADSYILIKDGEAYLFGTRIDPLPTASTHVDPDPTRTRKLLLHRKEINQLIGAIERAGYTAIPVRMYWQRGRAKLELALAKGKKLHDKRRDQKQKDWQRQKERLLREER